MSLNELFMLQEADAGEVTNYLEMRDQCPNNSLHRTHIECGSSLPTKGNPGKYRMICEDCKQKWIVTRAPDALGRWLYKPSDGNRGHYLCGLCGQPKKGHICPALQKMPLDFDATELEGNKRARAAETLTQGFGLTLKFVKDDGSSLHYAFLSCLGFCNHVGRGETLSTLEPTPIDRGRDLLCRRKVSQFISSYSPGCKVSLARNERHPIYPCKLPDDRGSDAGVLAIASLVFAFRVPCVMWEWDAQDVFHAYVIEDGIHSTTIVHKQWTQHDLKEECESQLFVHIMTRVDPVSKERCFDPLVYSDLSTFHAIITHVDKDTYQEFDKCAPYSKLKYTWECYLNRLNFIVEKKEYFKVIHSQFSSIDDHKKDCLSQGMNAILRLKKNGTSDTKIVYLKYTGSIGSECLAQAVDAQTELHVYYDGNRDFVPNHNCFCNMYYWEVPQINCELCRRWCHVRCAAQMGPVTDPYFCPDCTLIRSSVHDNLRTQQEHDSAFAKEVSDSDDDLQANDNEQDEEEEEGHVKRRKLSKSDHQDGNATQMCQHSHEATKLCIANTLATLSEENLK